MAKATFPSPPPPPIIIKSTAPIFIRRGNLADSTEIGRIAARTYLHTPLDQFLSPYRFDHYRHYERGYIHRARQRMFSPRTLTFVACTTAAPSVPIGYAQFQRLGNDAGALAQIHSSSLQWRLCLWVLGWLHDIFYRLLWLVLGGNQSSNMTAVNQFIGWVAGGDEHWEMFPERKNRWHAMSVVINAEFQGRGIGKALMGEFIKRAEKENVVIGIESSVKGEPMYRSVGFELLGRFSAEYDFEPNLGGFMMWTPPAWKEKESVKI